MRTTRDATSRNPPGPRRLPRGAAAGRRPSARRRFLLAPLAGGVALLAVFHVALLWARVTSLTLLEPTVALRWAASLGLLAILWHQRRAGVSLLWGRRALVFWLLVLLLHVSLPLAGGPPGEDLLASRAAADILLFLPVTAGVLIACELALGLLLPGGAPRAALAAHALARAVPPRRVPCAPGFEPSLFSRPPPA